MGIFNTTLGNAAHCKAQGRRMKLSDSEKREIYRLLDTDKPLPDKYRFLLFDDKREVELVWNGKTNEICNIVLPFQVIEQVDEPRTENPVDNGQSLINDLAVLVVDIFGNDTIRRIDIGARGV